MPTGTPYAGLRTFQRRSLPRLLHKAEAAEPPKEITGRTRPGGLQPADPGPLSTALAPLAPQPKGLSAAVTDSDPGQLEPGSAPTQHTPHARRPSWPSAPSATGGLVAHPLRVPMLLGSGDPTVRQGCTAGNPRRGSNPAPLTRSSGARPTPPGYTTSHAPLTGTQGGAGLRSSLVPVAGSFQVD